MSTTPDGEAPGAALDHPDGEPEVLGVAGALQRAVADAEVLVADPLEPEVRMAGAELARPGQRGIAERAVGERGEVGSRSGPLMRGNLSSGGTGWRAGSRRGRRSPQGALSRDGFVRLGRCSRAPVRSAPMPAATTKPIPTTGARPGTWCSTTSPIDQRDRRLQAHQRAERGGA